MGKGLGPRYTSRTNLAVKNLESVNFGGPLERSACVACPYESRQRCVETICRRPSCSRWPACMRRGLTSAKEVYLHPRRIPLADAVRLDQAELGSECERDGLINECEGHCGECANRLVLASKRMSSKGRELMLSMASADTAASPWSTGSRPLHRCHTIGPMLPRNGLANLGAYWVYLFVEPTSLMLRSDTSSIAVSFTFAIY